NGLPFAIRVSREINFGCFLGCFNELFHDFLLALDELVGGLKTFFHIDAEIALRQIFDVADGRLHVEVTAEVLLQSLCFRRGLDDNQAFAGLTVGLFFFFVFVLFRGFGFARLGLFRFRRFGGFRGVFFAGLGGGGF